MNEETTAEKGRYNMEYNNGKKLSVDYKLSDYPQPSLTADILIFSVEQKKKDSMDLLLIRRKKDPYEGCWALPGGFVNPNETADEAAARELKEETGVDNIRVRQLRLFSTPGRDPRGWVVTEAFMAVTNADDHSVKAGDDAASAEWFHINFTLKSSQDNVRTYYLELTGYAETLKAEAEVTEYGDDHSICITDSEGLAFDHAEMIVYGLLSLN